MRTNDTRRDQKSYQHIEIQSSKVSTQYTFYLCNGRGSSQIYLSRTPYCIFEAASAGSKEGNKNTAKGADVPCTDPHYAAKQAASDEATSNNTHTAQAEGDKQQM
ncbi:hypothetical protein E4U12_002887 [Claviceps purpurea]|nr:hypothetical protein E4U12_002887 [Claviceps purpurea]